LPLEVTKKASHFDPISPLSTAYKDEDLIPSECTIEQIKDALRWAKERGSFDHVHGDVPEPAQQWDRERLVQVCIEMILPT